MSKEDVLLFGFYGVRGAGKSYYEKLKEKDKEIERLNNIIKEARKILNNKREILLTKHLNGGYCNYEELLYQVDEEIRKILDKVGDSNNEGRRVVIKNENNRFIK